MLEVRYRGKNIHEVLNLTVKEALKFFAEVPKITDKLRLSKKSVWDISDWAIGHDAFRGRRSV